MREKLVLSLLLLIMATNLVAQQTVPQKPRILISSDIGGTDPDDNQSVAHFLMNLIQKVLFLPHLSEMETKKKFFG